jgi:hypothetical protein
MGTGIPQPMSCPDHGLDNREFESHQEQAIFFCLPQNAMTGFVAHPAPYAMGTVVLSRG